MRTPVQLDADTERDLRIYLWLSHGHKGMYGDDGEMQCAECRPTQDYKRAPLADVVRQARQSRYEVNMKILAADPVVSPPPNERERKLERALRRIFDRLQRDARNARYEISDAAWFSQPYMAKSLEDFISAELTAAPIVK